MLKFLPDVYINTDQNKGKVSGNSPGYGINLVAETTEGVFFSAEGVSSSKNEVSYLLVNFEVKETKRKIIAGFSTNSSRGSW